MAVEVIKETGLRTPGSNSYVSVLDIDDWVLTNPHDTTWATLTEAQKNGYAVMSCRILDEQMDWDGWVIEDVQSLRLPRSGMISKNGRFIANDEIPLDARNAQSEFARLLAISDRTGDSDLVGLSQLKIGPISLVADKSDSLPVLPDAVFNMIRCFGRRSISKGISWTMRA